MYNRIEIIEGNFVFTALKIIMVLLAIGELGAILLAIDQILFSFLSNFASLLLLLLTVASLFSMIAIALHTQRTLTLINAAKVAS